jgi:hypothetical protein
MLKPLSHAAHSDDQCPETIERQQERSMQSEGCVCVRRLATRSRLGSSFRHEFRHGHEKIRLAVTHPCECLSKLAQLLKLV